MSANYNKVILAGNLTRDPQMSYMPSQTAVTDFGMAINRKWKSKDGQQSEETCFVDCVAFGRTAEVINEHLTKGRSVLVEGRLKFESWEDKNSGQKRSKLKVVVENFQFLGGRDGAAQQAAPQQTRATEAAATPPVDGGEDVPF